MFVISITIYIFIEKYQRKIQRFLSKLFVGKNKQEKCFYGWIGGDNQDKSKKKGGGVVRKGLFLQSKSYIPHSL